MSPARMCSSRVSTPASKPERDVRELERDLFARGRHAGLRPQLHALELALMATRRSSLPPPWRTMSVVPDSWSMITNSARHEEHAVGQALGIRRGRWQTLEPADDVVAEIPDHARGEGRNLGQGLASRSRARIESSSSRGSDRIAPLSPSSTVIPEGRLR
jgi:hypothetical protein